jgi:ssDNA-binding Zn-finger/Zn-ribbon topoisomerase 1
MIGTIGNIIETDERIKFEQNIIPMIYDLQNPIIGQATVNSVATYVVRVLAGFVNPADKKYVYCGNVIYDTCNDTEQCGTLAAYIRIKQEEGGQFQGWFYPSQGCQGIYFTKNFTPSYDMQAIVMGWLSCSLFIVILWRQCCVRNMIETDLNILFCNGERSHCCSRIILDLQVNRSEIQIQNQSQNQLVLIANPTAAERNTNIRPIKIVDEDDGMCIISMEQIPVGGMYSECPQCKKVYSYLALQRWLATRDQCPHCRCAMTPATVRMYQNGVLSDTSSRTNIEDNEAMNYHQIGGGEVV